MNMILLPTKNTPRWLIFLIDLAIVPASVLLAYMLRFNFNIPTIESELLPEIFGYMLLVRGLSFLLGRSFTGMVRHTGTNDVVRVFLVVMLGSICFAITNLVTFHFINGRYLIPYSIIIIDFIATTLALLFYRILVKITYNELQHPFRQKSNVIIFGAGEGGMMAKRALDRDAGTKYKVTAFIDDDPKKIGKKIDNVSIYDFSRFATLLQSKTIAHVIISVQSINAARKKEIIETALEHNAKVLNVPPVSRWINGELSFKQIKKIRIEDLLDRDPIVLETSRILETLQGKRILISGAAGSIGSEIARQVAGYQPERLILLDQAESALYDLELEMGEMPVSVNFETVLCDILNRERMQLMFETFRPEIIFHAAAYKHVPMMEDNPAEAVLTNVQGTCMLADMAIRYGIEKFVMISSDKAVNPTNVMGASKRIAEIYTQSLNKQGKTRFITTRFGNVLGSNGSVIPRFAKQIECGGPLTLTHPKITRYFMTIPEACQLVLQAGSMGQGGEIFLFDMGKSVKILDLAKKMIALSGLSLGKDIQIIYTGLRPGEKLFEELLNQKENTLPTHNPRILIASVREYDTAEVNAHLVQLLQLASGTDKYAMVRKMKEMVPEYKSENSIFESLDNE
jgi:FlaA1/EpsC-like NDP-sugar epimerase